MRARLDKIVKGFEKTVSKLDKLTATISEKMVQNSEKIAELQETNQGLDRTYARASKVRSNVASLIVMD
jgi:archaellum component FlaC